MGIVTGIGDKNLNKNVIVPKIDADLNDYILNKNCIIDGLEVISNTLTAGTCVLKGYRGILENAETLNGETYIYGKFTLNFDNGITENLEVDDFDILKTNSEPQDGTINPTSITEQGIYYLLLYTYTNNEYVVNPNLDDTHKYPLHAYEANETDLIKNGAVIESDVIATTQARNDNSTKVATTEYVHNQIEEEIHYDTANVSMAITYQQTIGGSQTLSKTFVIKRKAKYIIANIENITGYVGNGFSSQIIATIPSGYRPQQQVYGCFVCTTSETIEGQLSPYVSVNPIRLIISTNGEITIDAKSFNYATITQGQIVFGYETN